MFGGQARAKVDKSINLLDLPLDERSYDLVVLSDWENDIIYSASSYVFPRSAQFTSFANISLSSSAPPRAPVPDLQRPLNAALDSGDWIHGIIWDAKTPFKDFSALEIEQPESDDTARISSAAAPSAANATSQTEKGKDKGTFPFPTHGPKHLHPPPFRFGASITQEATLGGETDAAASNCPWHSTSTRYGFIKGQIQFVQRQSI
jgi:hypothetical protein